MSYRISPRPLRALAAVTALAVSAMSVAAQDSTTPPSNPAASDPGTAAPTSASQPATTLSYGVPDVLKLSQGKVGDDTIVSYIQSSGSSYGCLTASGIIYLHEQGVSDRRLHLLKELLKEVHF